MNTFTINGKEYKAKPFDFNLVCDLEDMGISLEEAGRKPMSMVRAYFGICAGKGKNFSGKEMEAHIINGGKFDEMEKSDFFHSLNKTEKTENATDKRTEKEKFSQK